MKKVDLTMDKILEGYKNIFLEMQEVLNNIKVDKLDDKTKADIAYIKSSIEEVIDFENKYNLANDEDSERIIKVIEEFNSNVNKAIKVIALHRKLKEHRDRKGVEAPAYKNIDLQQIENDYKSGLTVTELMNKYGVTRPTMISRLKTLGIYKKL